MLNRRSFLLASGLLATGAALGGAAWTGRTSGGVAGLAALSPVGAASAQGADVAEMTLGDPNAPVKVVEYASFTCPHCASFHQDTFKEFREQYVDTGRVHFTYREVFFDRYGLWAAMIARCAGPERYFGVADLIYATQDEWVRQSDPAAVAESLKRIGLQAGLDRETVDACLEDAETAQNLVAWYERNASRDGIRSTPSFLVNGELYSGNMGLARLGELVDAAS
jgi:protein-disulfide isomerase